MFTVHVAPPAKLDSQVFVCVKSDGFVPLKLKPFMAMAAVLPFVTVIALATLEVPTTVEPNVTLFGEGVIAACSVPESDAVFGVSTASSAIEMVAERVLLPCGVKVTVMVHVEPTAKAPLQLLV
jgi:hypothetical protein